MSIASPNAVSFSRVMVPPAAPIIVDRNERRIITAGQKAMAHAMLFPVATEKGARGKTPPQPLGV